MNTPPELLLPASDQARRIAQGVIPAEQLLDWQQAAIDARNPQINAFVQRVVPGTPVPGASPLAGSTFAVKDNIDAAGLPTHGGLRALHAAAATQDAPVVARLKAGGLAFLGKLNMHAMALGATNHNRDFGDCRNPRRPTHTPGGSSGGSGAAVAAGLCGIALGTDTMGSVRVPASYCGVVGFKPSWDALPTAGVLPLCRLLDHVGVLARSVEDVRHAFALLRDTPLHQPVRDEGDILLGIPADPRALGADPDVLAAFDLALQRLRDAGFRMQPVAIPVAQFSPVRRAGLLVCEAELAGTLAGVLRERRGEIPPDLLGMLEFPARKSAPDLAAAIARMVDVAQWVARTLAGVDALLLPTTPQAAFAMDAPVPANQADYTVLANLSGSPAISLPLPVADGALPIGLQAMAARGRDDALLALAARLETLLAR